MRTFAEHLAAVQALFPDPRPAATLPLVDAAARHARAAADITARFDSPRFDNSQMDGYALSSCKPGTFTAGPTIAAGASAAELYPHGLQGGTAAPIMTGAPAPAGTQCIVPVEDCRPAHFVAEGETIETPGSVPGKFIRPAGSDARRGDLVVPGGAVIDPIAVATLAGQGYREVTVQRPARILIVTGGNEIDQDPKTPASTASIPDSNGPLLAALAQRYGIEVAGSVRTDDDPAALAEQLAAGIDKHQPDAVVTSGGISHGKFEVVRQVLEPQPGSWFGHVVQQPGGPQGLATLNGTPCICLPGNPVSTLVSFRLYVAPTLGTAPRPEEATLVAAEPLHGLPAKDQYLRGIYRDGIAHVRGGAGSHLIAQAVGANCLIHLPHATTVEEGARVVVYPF